MSENRFLGSISASTIRNLLPRSVSNKHKPNSTRSKPRHNDENIRPIDPNIAVVPVSPSLLNKQSLPKPSIPPTEIAAKDEEPMPPPSDPPVKVFARIRPSHGHEFGDLDSVRKVSKDSVAVGDRKFTFDTVLGLNSNQEDVFQLVGVPLVKNALAGYNTSILAYGQTGSGKTYTMWGPPSAMVDCQLANREQGIVPRIFQMLFSEIQQEQENSDDRQVNYQCRCSFLEIYNEEIGDLLDPTQRNLEIKDDAKHGFYVENLTEEYVTSYEDITQLLVKGLSSRKVGATSINSKSSRSHIVFTCVIESWSKGTSSHFGSSKTSRISLVDLAGLERNKLDDDGKQVMREEKSVKKSLSQLGHLVNILAEGTQDGKPEDEAYRSSRLTHLLKESLGGNVKLTVICTISSDKKSNSETLSTIRFGQRVKSIHNEPVINEISEDDVNDLSDQIRQLKDELIRAKSNTNNSERGTHEYSNGQNVRRSLNQLRLSLNRSLILPRFDNDTNVEINYSEDDVRELRLQLDNMNSSCEENNKAGNRHFALVEDNSDTEMASEQYGSCLEESENEESYCTEEFGSSFGDTTNESDVSHSIDTATRSSISIRTPRYSSAFPDPTLSESPKVGNNQRKSVTFASSHLASENIVSNSSKFDSSAIQQSQRSVDHLRSSLRSSKIFSGPTESLAASLRGLQIIESHQQNSELNRSSLAFSFEHLALKPSPTADKANASLQTLPEDKTFVCASCRKTGFTGANEVEDSLKTWLVPVDETEKSNGSAGQAAKDMDKGSEESNTRVKELENICSEQAAKIEHLNLLVEEYKHKLEQNATIGHGSEIVQIVEAQNENLPSLEDGKKLLKWNDSESEEECIKEKCEIKEVREESDYSHNNSKPFNTDEKEALLNEIQSLKCKLLLSRSDGSLDKSYEKVRSSLLSQSLHLRKSGVFAQCNNEEEFEKERERWMEMESEWICLTDELRVDLESTRRRAEKVEMELKLEKRSTEELDDALSRSVLGHGRMVEHYVDLQDKYNDLVEKHKLIMQGVADVKRAAAKAGAKGHGSRFAKYLAAELSSMKVERAREMELLKKENKNLKVQLRDTAEAVHAAGEVLVRLREAEEAASVAEENVTQVNEENDKLKKQVDKLKRKHKMEMITMKQYLAESRLPESALRPLYREDSDVAENNSVQHNDDEAWRAEFGAIYQDHY